MQNNHLPGSVNAIVGITIAGLRSRTPDPPYCWQNKEALRQIERTFDSESRTRLASVAYLALTRIASDRQAETFECSIKEIAAYMHYGYEEALKGIALAETASVIKIERRKIPGTKENAHSVYNLLRVIGISDKVIGKPLLGGFRETLERTEKEQRNKREEATFPSLKEAAEFFQPEFPELYVKRSLSDMVFGKEGWALTKSNCRRWLTIERAHRRKVKWQPPTAAEPKQAAGKEQTEQPISLEEQAELAKQFKILKNQMNGAKAAEEIDK